MHIHILGVCGTFMGGVALLAKQMGYDVSGSDTNVYPPMSTQLLQEGIRLQDGYSAKNLRRKPDLVVIGNALSRGNPEVEAVLNQGLAYVSGPQWLGENLLRDRWVVGVAGTHGKTTTSSMIAWILEYAGFNPGFLIGGIPLNLGLSARLGEGQYFVVEADEYDTAFFDKRSKFVHYRPKTAILNNLEFDHADIFDNIEDIKKQFHHFIRTVPGNGLIISPQNDKELIDVIGMGCWTRVENTLITKNMDSSVQWSAILDESDSSSFQIVSKGNIQGQIDWTLSGRHNVYNALSAIAGVVHLGLDTETAIEALRKFKNVKRRMEIRAKIGGVTLYDDFAHHPTAIASTLEGLRAQIKNQRIIAVVEPRSNTMRTGVHADALPISMNAADLRILYQPVETTLNISDYATNNGDLRIFNSIDGIVDLVCREARSGDHVVFMSNGAFAGIHERVESLLNEKITFN